MPEFDADKYREELRKMRNIPLIEACVAKWLDLQCGPRCDVPLLASQAFELKAEILRRMEKGNEH